MSRRDTSPELTIILCTHNPRRDVFRLVLEALRKQTLEQSRWELIVVDNNSNPPLKVEDFPCRDSLPLRMVRETQPGLTAARICGMREAAADLLLLVDDDNILDPDYLEAAVDIAKAEPRIGAFGGISRPILEAELRCEWKRELLPYLGVRDYGESSITSSHDEWGHWEPIGAGMVLRRDVARKYAMMVDADPLAACLDRSGSSLLSGGDSLIARSAYRVGYSCSYQPRLKLSHFIKKERLRTLYLGRLLYGHGRSFVILSNVLGTPQHKLHMSEVLGRLRFRCRKQGIAGLVCWSWDLGYLVESRMRRKTVRA